MESENTLFGQHKTKINISLVNRDATYFDKILPGLTKRQSEVLEAVKDIQPCTMHEVSDVLNKPLNKSDLKLRILSRFNPFNPVLKIRLSN